MLEAEHSQLLIIDLQERLMPAISEAEEITGNARKLIKAAEILSVPIAATEQYPKGLGPTAAGLLPHNIAPLTKTTFNSMRTAAIAVTMQGELDIVVAGTEAHVCVLQTVLGLLEGQRRVFVVADAVGSRREPNKLAALSRMKSHGAELVTTEMVIFEWLCDASHPRFREVLEIIK